MNVAPLPKSYIRSKLFVRSTEGTMDAQPHDFRSRGRLSSINVIRMGFVTYVL